MDLFVFHGVNKDQGDLYRYAKDKDEALQSLGPRILDPALPGLINSVPTTAAEMPNVLNPTSICWFQVIKKPPLVQICCNLGILDWNMLII